MIADFTISIHRDDRPERAVRVAVYNNTAALRSAVTQYERHNNGTGRAVDGLLGVCHRFYSESYRGRGKDRKHAPDPLCAIVRLAPPNIGIGVISHELAHAAVWIQEIDNNFENAPLLCENDEEFRGIDPANRQQIVRKGCIRGITFSRGIFMGFNENPIPRRKLCPTRTSPRSSSK